MSLTKFTGDTNVISGLADKPARTATQLKGDFDTVGRLLKEYINEHLTEELDTKFTELTNKINSIYPVGAIYMSVNDTNPSTLFGGTWVAWGSGKVPVGVNTSETEFNSVEKTGGAKTHTLSTAQIPSHNHGLNNHTHSIPSLSGYTDRKDLQGNIWNMAIQSTQTGLSSNGIASNNNVSGSNIGYAEKSATTYSDSITDSVHINASHNHTITTNSSTTGQASGNTGNTGSGEAHNNLQPYITCYMWKRTA